MKKYRFFIIITGIALIVITLVISSMFESKIRKDAPALLTLNNFKVISEGKFNYLQQQVEYVVERDGKKDTLNVKLTHGALTIQPK